jgi:hypothetical protein
MAKASKSTDHLVVPGQLELWGEENFSGSRVARSVACRGELLPGTVFRQGDAEPPVGAVVCTPGGRLHTRIEEGWVGAGWSWRELVATFSGRVVLVRINPPGVVPTERVLPSTHVAVRDRI